MRHVITDRRLSAWAANPDRRLRRRARRVTDGLDERAAFEFLQPAVHDHGRIDEVRIVAGVEQIGYRDDVHTL